MTHVNESGRSMVEMLGVLAIIGVLSIGGIAGYTIAMNRYRANEILDTGAKLAVIAHTKSVNTVDNTAGLSDLGITSGTIGGCASTMTATAQTDGTTTVAVSGCSSAEGVVKAMRSILGGDSSTVEDDGSFTLSK